MVSIRRTVGIGLLSALMIIILSGFVANSSRDLFLVLIGFVSGLITVYLLDALKRRDVTHTSSTR